MIARPLELDFDKALAELQRKRSSERTPSGKGKRHLSEVIHRLCVQLDPKRFGGGDEDSAPDPTATFHRGFLWEDALSLVLGRDWYGSESTSQMEIEEDGIIMTIDWFSRKRWRVLEAKSTKISAAHPITSERFWHWKVQLACYCRAMRTQEAELLVYFINGSYELGGGRFGKEVAKAWLVRFTEIEQEELWRMVLKTKRRMDAEEGEAA